jgi:PAS domain S-box-containing protein
LRKAGKGVFVKPINRNELEKNSMAILVASSAVWRQRAAAYGFAFLISALALQVRLSLVPWVGNRSALIIFFWPVLLSVYVGGLGPGLLATALCSVGVYHFMPPAPALGISNTAIFWLWSVFIINGVLISLIVEAMHRSRRRAEAASRLQAVTLASIGDAVVTTDREGRVTFLNHEAECLTEWTAAEARGVPLGQVFHIVNARTQEPVADPATKVLATGLAVGLANHTRLLGRKGRKTLIDDSGAPIKDGKGRIAGVVLVFRDCTEKRMAEEALRESQALYRSLVEQLPAGVFRKDGSGRYVFVNSFFCQFKGITPDQFIGKLPEELPASQVAARSLGTAHHERIMRTGQSVEELEEYQHPDGRTMYFQLVKSPVFAGDGRITGSQGILIDVTQRKQEEQRLRQLAVIVESSEEAIIGIDLAGIITSWNRGAETVFGYTAEESVGRSTAHLYPADQGPERAEILAWLGRGESLEHVQTERIRKDGKRIRLSSTISPVKDEHGVVVGRAAIAHDITREQMLEEQLRQAQKMDAIGQLAGGVAHDFNNILAVIQMQIELCQMDEATPAERQAYLKEVQVAANRAAHLTRQLLLFSRRQRPQPRELDLSESITGMATMLRRILGEDIQIQFKYAAQPLWIQADAGMLDQLLMNLTLNSRDAMPEGGRLVIETAAAEVDEVAALQSAQARAGSFARLSVADTGCGIRPEVLPRIFEPFFTTKDVGKGTGLGLATVFSIVQQHRGWINVATQPGRGTTFDIYLPRVAPAPAPAAEAGCVHTPMVGGTETILLVEDDDALRGSVHRCLSQLGYRLLAAADGAMALRLWETHREQIQLLLTDLVMPGGMNGKELGERLRRESPKLKVIYVSGYSAEIFTEGFPQVAGTTFLAKPFPAQILAQTVRACCDGK